MVVRHGDYSNFSNSRTKIPAMFQDKFIIFCGISKLLCIYSTISCGTLRSRGAMFGKRLFIAPTAHAIAGSGNTTTAPSATVCS